MIEPTCSWRDAASVVFDLPDYLAIDAVDLPSGSRRMFVQADSVELIVVKPQLVCGERVCPHRRFTQTTPELPLPARCTS